VVLIYFSSFLLLTFLIPISLNVSIEAIKAFLGVFLGFDDKMYHKPIDKRCQVFNISIIEELGQIDFVLTDKTGTLTAN
jgi:P-type E1-E2 ATPase